MVKKKKHIAAKDYVMLTVSDSEENYYMKKCFLPRLKRRPGVCIMQSPFLVTRAFQKLKKK